MRNPLIWCYQRTFLPVIDVLTLLLPRLVLMHNPLERLLKLCNSNVLITAISIGLLHNNYQDHAQPFSRENIDFRGLDVCFFFQTQKITIRPLDWAHYMLDPRSFPAKLTKQQAVTKIVQSILFSSCDECERVKDISTLVFAIIFTFIFLLLLLKLRQFVAFPKHMMLALKSSIICLKLF